MKNSVIVVGTRPEAIKMAPLIIEMRNRGLKCYVCATGQHLEMLYQVFNFFEIKIDFDLKVMTRSQTLLGLNARLFSGLTNVIEEVKPEYVFVHGDTASCLAGALSGYYFGAKVLHVEAGLRTYDIQSPFPEEGIRQMVSRISTFNFTPTSTSRQNLIDENINNKSIVVTGNTVIDALRIAVNRINSKEFKPSEPRLRKLGGKYILVTAHRRENRGENFEKICRMIADVASKYNDYSIVFPVHLNPELKQVSSRLLSSISNVYLVDPLDYPDFVYAMKNATVIVTDSGGIQEEAPSLGIPIIVLREKTERPEAVESGSVILTGLDNGKFMTKISELLNSRELLETYRHLENPYGDGYASQRIIEHIQVYEN